MELLSTVIDILWMVFVWTLFITIGILLIPIVLSFIVLDKLDTIRKNYYINRE